MPTDPPLGLPVCTTPDCSDQGKSLQRIGMVNDEKGRPFQQYECPSCQQRAVRPAD